MCVCVCVCVCVCECKRLDIVCMWRVTHKFMQGRGYAKVTWSKICTRVGIESCTFRDRIDDT